MPTISQITIGETVYDLLSKVESGVTSGAYKVTKTSSMTSGNLLNFPEIVVDDYGRIIEASNYGYSLNVLPPNGDAISTMDRDKPALVSLGMYNELKSNLDYKVLHKWGDEQGFPLKLSDSLSDTVRVSLSSASWNNTANYPENPNTLIGDVSGIALQNDTKFLVISGVEAIQVWSDNEDYFHYAPINLNWEVSSTRSTGGLLNYERSLDVTVSIDSIPSNRSVYYYILYSVCNHNYIM